jgi:hypothetical protein
MTKGRDGGKTRVWIVWLKRRINNAVFGRRWNGIPLFRDSAARELTLEIQGGVS